MKRDFTNRYGKSPLKAILLSLLIIFICASAFCGCVSAAGTENEVTVTISGNDYTNWTYLVDNLSSTDKSKVTVKLDCDIDNGSYWRGITDSTQILAKGLGVINISSGDKTLDLNGHNINLNSSGTTAKTNDYFILFNVTNGSSLTIKNSGNSENYIAANVTAMIVVSDGSDFTLGNNVNLTIYGKPNLPIPNPATTLSMVIGILAQNETDAAISYVKLEEGSIVNDNSEYDNVYAIYIVQRGFLAQIVQVPQKVDEKACGVNLVINGKVNGHRGILLHGYVQNVNPSAPNVTICDNAVINADKGSAIVTCGYGNWNFNGGKVTGHDALMINSGKFTITGGEFIGNGGYVNEPLPSSLENGGELNSSAAITVVGDNQFIGNVSITITGGTFTSSHGYAFYESDNKTNPNNIGTALKKLSITGGTFTGNKSLYPMYILMNGTVDEGVYVSLNDQTPFYPGLNTSAAHWVNDSKGWWNVTLKENIVNVMSLDLSKVPGVKTKVEYGNYNFVKVSNDDKYSFDGWSNDKSASDTIFEGGVKYIPTFTYIKQYDTGEEVEDDEPIPTIEPTPIVTPTQNQTVKPTVKPTPEPKTVVIVENEVKFEDNKVITSITVPEGSSGSITFTQTEEKGMDEWIPESIEDTYSFDLSCDGEINGDSEIHFVMSDVILKSLGLTPEDVCLKHFEDGVWVKLKISYIILDDGTYYYTAVTKSFSPFEISFDAKSEEPTVTPTEEQPTQSPMPILGLLAGLGAAALVLRRK